MASDPLSSVVLLLVSFLGWVIVRFASPISRKSRSAPLLRLAAGDPGLGVAARAEQPLAASACRLDRGQPVPASPADVLCRPAGGAACRPQKFVVSRLAELSLAAAIALIGSELHTLQIDQVLTQISRLSTLPATLRIAAVLVVLSVCLKSAQLPFTAG